ncbi:MAG: DUF1540 domain-containing protein [bacterium]|nr:DUF1540 domain-containing protein [bacterium]
MTQVQCSVDTCSYNKDHNCYMNPIKVGGKGAPDENDTCCGSFLSQRGYSNLAEYTSSRGAADTVACDVNSCKFNNNCRCQKDAIEVNGTRDTIYYTETNCGSYENVN